METWEVREEKGGEWRTDRIQAGTAPQPLGGAGGPLALGPLPQGHCCASLSPDFSRVAGGRRITCIVQLAVSGQRSS